MPDEFEEGFGYEKTLRDSTLSGVDTLSEEDDELMSEESEEGQSNIARWTVGDKVTAALGGFGTVAATWGAFHSPEGSPIKPYDGLIFFGGIACVLTTAGIVALSAWKNRERPSTYSD